MPLPCLPDQAAALLRLKRSFTITNDSECTLASWRAGTDCCRWEGVRCGGANGDGRVRSLDLARCFLESAAIDPALFDLTSLRYLNLAHNDFNGSELPSTGFERLKHLAHLNLSDASIQGKIPVGIRHLTNLVSLDLSTTVYLLDQDDLFLSFGTWSNPSWWVVEPNIGSLVANLSSLRELYLGRVDLSDNGEDWCTALTNSSTPQLQVLSLRHCRLFGPICTSLSSTHSLTEINLQYNGLYGPVPDSFADLHFLRVLDLADNDLEGLFPKRILQNRNLTTVHISYNTNIYGSLPNFSPDSSLTTLIVSSTNFSGPIPSSIGNLKSLNELGVASNDFRQELPSSIGQLTSLKLLEATGAAIVGTIPSWIANLTSLVLLRFSNCGLSGPIPSSIGNLKNLTRLELYRCNFYGTISPHIFNLTHLKVMYLHSNNLTGTVELSSFWKLPHLFSLNLSGNRLTIVDGDVSSSHVNNMNILRLASCNMSKFPDALRHMSFIQYLDLSDNKIPGAIPQWAWETWSQLVLLNISHNKFSSVLGNALPVDIESVDLSFNQFEGPIPTPAPDLASLDCSNNQFSSMPFNFSYQLSGICYFMASRNNLSGEIPSSICDARSLVLLDLSYNNLSGSIPSCLIENTNSLSALNLEGNQLTGKLPHNIKKGCAFEELDFSKNSIEGQLPRSLVECRDLQVFDIGDNQISDTFPCWMSVLPKLQVLVLKSNKFFGMVGPSVLGEQNNCDFMKLRILSLASNSFSGTLPIKWFKTFKSMMVKSSDESLSMENQYSRFSRTYQFTAAITYKGHDVTFSKILRTLVTIDVSDNALNGTIPKSIGELALLRGLNMSHNTLTGPIPSQLGALQELESLDLSSNDLSGEIPQELAQLHFLSVLNLSYNALVGRIPDSPQLSNNLSYLGNIGLCGFPLSKECSNMTMLSSHPSEEKHVDVILFLFVGLGVGIGFAVIIVVTWGIRIKKRSQDNRFSFWKKVLCM
uniref:non-specific serine/threonine protein kinase n=1 Tax=Oryza glumipatula TaxID=40148 RepID=A0A0D9Y3K5_9ORYZ